MDQIREFNAQARNDDDMPWAIGFQLGRYCGREDCKQRPGAYSQMCDDHRTGVRWLDRGRHVVKDFTGGAR